MIGGWEHDAHRAMRERGLASYKGINAPKPVAAGPLGAAHLATPQPIN